MTVMSMLPDKPRGSKRAPKHETAYARAAYEQYAAMGPTRSLRKLAKEWKDGQGSEQAKLYWLAIWSSRFAWQDRVIQYDQDQAEKTRMERDERRRMANRKQYEFGERAMERAILEIERLADSEAFGPQAAAQLLKIGAELQRLTTEDEKDEGKDQRGGQIQIVIANVDGTGATTQRIIPPVIDSTISD